MALKPTLLKLHRWIGLATGAILVIVCLSGTILVFEPQLTRSLHPEYYTVSPSGERLSVDGLLGKLRTFNSLIRPRMVRVPGDSTATVTVLDRSGAQHFINPYSGKVLGYDVHRPAFFETMRHLHTRLLDDEFGEWLVLGSTIGFALSLLIGLILWWPRTARALAARLSVAKILGRRVTLRRRNYDLHVVLGLYALPVLFVLGVTGLGFDADWFYTGVNRLAGAPAEAAPPTNTGSIRDGLFSLESAYQAARTSLGAARDFDITVPLESSDPIEVDAAPPGAPYADARDAIWFDRYTGRTLRLDRYADLPVGVRMRRILEPLHLATIGGTTTQVIGFVAMLLGVTFPFTGFLMWFPRWKRQKRGAPPPPEEVALPSVLEDAAPPPTPARTPGA